MDTLTHTVLGACMGEAIAGKQLGKKAMLIGALANNLPDVDVVSTLWCTEAQELLAHRGITHSLLFNTICTVFLAYVLRQRFKGYDITLLKWMVLAGSGLFTHIFIDAFTSYGTGWFEPFNHARVSFNTMFILDPFFMLPVLAGAVLLLILKAISAKRKAVAALSLTLSVLYVLFTFVNKTRVNIIVQKNLAAQGISYRDYIVTPTALNNFLWYVVTRSDRDPVVGYYSLFDKNEAIGFYSVSKNDSLLEPYHGSDEINKLLQFSKGYYCMRREGTEIVFNDMRFGLIGGWLSPNVPFVFKFNVRRGKDNAVRLEQARFEPVKRSVLNDLVKRIEGN
ncbi:MAG: metal-dependent hydrolase [Bacteroidia bacterium]